MKFTIESNSDALKAIRGFQVLEQGRLIATIYENGAMLLAAKAPVISAA